ncbi:MAG TPA: hypothetical protein VH352_01720 [Pseudonocardiaceae bacterium]|jgi:hypothetical protein|nr:hypothetical protein [Pseudonocardiaceae bacterium]
MTDDRAFPELDPIIHARARPRVTVALATLAADDRIAFPRLKELLALTGAGRRAFEEYTVALRALLARID